MVDSAAKGAAYERRVAKDLSLWASGGKDPHVFSRRAGSGGSPRDLEGHSGASGDIYADKPSGRWLTDSISFELKFWKSLERDLWYLIAGDTQVGKIPVFIDQAAKSAAVYKRWWCLILKGNRLPSLVVTNCDFLLVKASVIDYKGSEVSLGSLQELLLRSNPAKIKRTLQLLKQET